MAEKAQVQPRSSKKRKTLFESAKNKKDLDKARNQTRVNIGVAFQRWRNLRDSKMLKSDAIVALFLLDSYEKQTSTSTPSKSGFKRLPAPPVSTIVSESLSDRDDDFIMSSLDLNADVISENEYNHIQNSIIDWEDDTWCPDKEADSVSSLEEDETKEVDTDFKDSEDEDYMPRICVRYVQHSMATCPEVT
ncbi:hypothetical protein UPYG_G00206280 [Umbra pygmaea]|uniref:Uncharacterized protein n=1 Tax=Umbra pygmaea TaxID=75934 RepID=A0ABD0WJJ5_UMBPY